MGRGKCMLGRTRGVQGWVSCLFVAVTMIFLIIIKNWNGRYCAVGDSNSHPIISITCLALTSDIFLVDYFFIPDTAIRRLKECLSNYLPIDGGRMKLFGLVSFHNGI